MRSLSEYSWRRMSRMRDRCSPEAAAYRSATRSASSRAFCSSGVNGRSAGSLGLVRGVGAGRGGGWCAAAAEAKKTSARLRMRIGASLGLGRVGRCRGRLFLAEPAELVLDLLLLVREVEAQPLRRLLRELVLRPRDV